MKKTDEMIIKICMTAIAAICIFLQMKSCVSDRKYDKLLEKYNALAMTTNANAKIDAESYKSNNETGIIWRTANSFIIRKFEVGEIDENIFSKNDVYVKSYANELKIKDGSGIYLPSPNAISHDFEYVSFVYDETRYLIVAKACDNVGRYQVFGKTISIDDDIVDQLSCVRFCNKTKFYFSKFNDHKYFIKKWVIGEHDNNCEYITCYRTYAGKLAIEFHAD